MRRAAPVSGTPALVGKRGQAETDLAPRGRVRIDSVCFDAFCNRVVCAEPARTEELRARSFS